MNCNNPLVAPGVETLFSEREQIEMLKGGRVGLVTNPSGVDSRLASTIDLFHLSPHIRLEALFGPEHGIRGDVYAGKHVEGESDDETGAPVHSLYGETRRPRPEWLEPLDIVVYDIQDIGATSYTYIYTMAYMMEACAEAGIPFVVLDRPNYCGADYTDGPVLDTSQQKSFVGLYDMAYMYGMTPGETARLINGEFHAKPCDLRVVPMRGYERWMRAWDTGLPFVPPSTHIARPQHAFYFSLTGILAELRDVLNVGLGYTLPFECVAAPWIDRSALTRALIEKEIPGLFFRPITFLPKYAGYKGEACHGIHAVINDYDVVRPTTAQLHIMETIQRLHPAPIEIEDETGGKRRASIFDDRVAEGTLFDKVLANDHVRQMLLAGESAEKIIATFEPRQKAFETMREKYLLY